MENLTQNVDTLFANMQNFTQKEGLIGKPVVHGERTFLPVVSITLGYGGGDSQTKAQGSTSGAGGGGGLGNMMGGALGLGAKLCTDAVLVIDKNNVLLAPIGTPGNISQIIDKVPQIISNMSSNNQQNSQQNNQQQQQQSQMHGQK